MTNSLKNWWQQLKYWQKVTYSYIAIFIFLYLFIAIPYTIVLINTKNIEKNPAKPYICFYIDVDIPCSLNGVLFNGFVFVPFIFLIFIPIYGAIFEPIEFFRLFEFSYDYAIILLPLLYLLSLTITLIGLIIEKIKRRNHP